MVTYHDIPGMKTIELVVDGKVTKQDYEALTEHMKDRIQQWGEVNVLEDIRNFEGFELSTFWDNIKFASQHFKDFKRCAVVTDKKWIRAVSDAADPLLKMELKTYPREEIEAARQWCSQPH